MKTPWSRHPLTRALALGVLVLGTVMVMGSSVPYLLPGMAHPFMQERPALTAQALWRLSLIIHIVAGMICLPGGLLLMSPKVACRWPGLHRVMGRIYVALIVGLLFPTGIFLAWHAKGGPAAGLGFFLSDIVATLTAIYAVKAAVGGNLAAHRRGMLRSYAQLASAISFRIYHIIFQLTALPYEEGYIASLWLSVIGNALIAEVIIGASLSTRTLTPNKRTPPCDQPRPSVSFSS